jgi:hypothetical protein
VIEVEKVSVAEKIENTVYFRQAAYGSKRHDSAKRRESDLNRRIVDDNIQEG